MPRSRTSSGRRWGRRVAIMQTCGTVAVPAAGGGGRGEARGGGPVRTEVASGRAARHPIDRGEPTERNIRGQGNSKEIRRVCLQPPATDDAVWEKWRRILLQ